MTVRIYISTDLAFQLHRPPTHTRGHIITRHKKHTPAARPQKTHTRPRHTYMNHIIDYTIIKRSIIIHRSIHIHNTFVRPGGTKTWKKVRG